VSFLLESTPRSVVVAAAREAGLALEDFAPRLSFFWNAHSHLFEEAAKFRAARRLWARLLRERTGTDDPECLRLRFHAQTAGSTLTAAQPEVNVVRTTLQALAAVLGGTQSLHTNAADEALGLPTAEAATLALRTQQVLAYESGVADTIDPLAGSYYVEWLTDRLEEAAQRLIAEVDAAGGAVAAVEAGLVRRAVEEAAYRQALRVESGEAVVVGVNRFVAESEGAAVPISRPDPAAESEQTARLAEARRRRDAAAVAAALEELRRVAAGAGNLLYPMHAALGRGATLGEISGAFVEVFGRYRPGS